VNKELIMYHRTYGCPFVTVAKQVLRDYDVPYREIFIDQDMSARERVINWTGFQSVPTLVVTNPGEILPYEEPDYLERGFSPRGINRGSMITEPNIDQLTVWLKQHGFISAAVAG
jgi:glutaredoxin